MRPYLERVSHWNRMTIQAKSYGKTRAAKSTRSKADTRSTPPPYEQDEARVSHVRFLPGYLILVLVALIILPNVLSTTLGAAGRVLNRLPGTVTTALNISVPGGPIASLFTPEVRYWGEQIRMWADDYNLDPNLLATVMQIESCGHSTVSSSAGAQGLFQVMPFHFEAGENQLDPNTNAQRGASFLSQCIGWANGDPGRAMACYNGGPGVLQRSFASWPAETQRYYNWGTQIYADAAQGYSSSATLDQWLAAGGQSLCSRAAADLGLR